MRCPSCGKENPENASSCAHCGAAFSQIEPSSPEKPRTKRGMWASIHAFLYRPVIRVDRRKRTSKLATVALVLVLFASPVGPMISEAVAAILHFPSADALPFSTHMPTVGICFIALVLGIAARVRIGRSGGRIGGSGTATGAAALSALLLAYMYALTSPGWTPPWSADESTAKNVARFLIRQPGGMGQYGSQNSSCRNNLKQIGIALHIYAIDHHGKFPVGATAVEAFSELVENEGAQGHPLDLETFVCPAAWNNVKAWVKTRKLTEKTCSYDYVPGLSEEFPGDFILAYDKTPDNHWGMGRFVLFVDSHVEWLREETFQQLLAEQRAKMASATSQSGGTPQ